MLVFIIPLKSARVSNSWERVSKLFERCVRSLCQQTSSEFRVIVVCHEKPDIEFSHPYITYIEVNFPIPIILKDKTNKGRDDQDKNRKVFTGLIHARQLKPSHIMLVDADDCVSKNLTEFVNQNSQHNGWFIDRGYEYQDGSDFIYHRKSNFHRKCGTSHIVRHDLIDPPSEVTLDDIDWNFLYHQEITNIMEKKGSPLDLLPFEGAIYIQENGENICNQEKILLKMFNKSFPKIILFYARKNYKSLTSQRVTKSLRDEFGLYNIR